MTGNSWPQLLLLLCGGGGGGGGVSFFVRLTTASTPATNIEYSCTSGTFAHITA